MTRRAENAEYRFNKAMRNALEPDTSKTGT
jgi:hypothetical protein